MDTRSRDLERHFEPYGKIVQVRIRKNFAFIQYETQEEATKALESTNMREAFIHKLSGYLCGTIMSEECFDLSRSCFQSFENVNKML